MTRNGAIKGLLIVICLLIMGSHLAMASTSESDLLAQSVQEQLRALDLDSLTDFVEQIDVDYQEFLPKLDWQTIFRQGQINFSFLDLLTKMLRYLFKELLFSSHLMRQLLVVALLSALLRQLQLSVDNKELINIAFAVCFLVIIYIALQSFRSALLLASTSIDNMVSFMYALLPMMATMVAAVGGITSATIFHPLLMAATSGIAFMIRTVLFPLLNINAVIGLVAQIAPDFPLGRLAGLVKHFATMLLSLAFTIFLGVLAVRGAIAPVADGVALRAAKFLTSNIVPVIGGMFANAVEVVVGGSLLIKNTIGVFGMLMIFFLVALPIIKIWAIVLIYRLIAALIEPITDPRISETVASMASALTLVMVSLATVALMFFLTITILVGVGNIAAVMR